MYLIFKGVMLPLYKWATIADSIHFSQFLLFALVKKVLLIPYEVGLSYFSFCYLFSAKDQLKEFITGMF